MLNSVRIIAVILAAMAFGSRVSAADLVVVTNTDHTATITLMGQIEDEDVDHLWSILARMDGSHIRATVMELNSPGGRVNAGERLAGAVLAKKMQTIVTAGSTCASACFLVFAAGSGKIVEAGARVGVHSAADVAAAENGETLITTVLMARFARSLGVPPVIIGRMVTTLPEDIAWLSPVELDLMHVIKRKPVVVTASSQPVVPSRPIVGRPNIFVQLMFVQLMGMNQKWATLGQGP